MSAREAALQTLVAMDHQKAWSNGHLKKVIQEAHLDRRDAALATRLCFGVLQNRMLLDHYLQQYSTMKLTKMESKVRSSHSPMPISRRSARVWRGRPLGT